MENYSWPDVELLGIVVSGRCYSVYFFSILRTVIVYLKGYFGRQSGRYSKTK